MRFAVFGVFAHLFFYVGSARAEGPPAYAPQIAAASDEAEKALARIRVPEGLAIELFAAEPLLANPVALAIDERGRLFVCETFRLHAGVTDNRWHMNWLDDDLACRTVDDRVAMYKKHLGEGITAFTLEHERLRRVEDLDGDGRADRATVLADGFNQIADGVAAGVLARGSKIFYTCIPDLWLLKDADDDGRAEWRQALHHGFGVHTAFIGHDLHGLRIGPDGKLYFSIGDRGFNVVADGRTLAYPDCGAVLRCELDGSELEVVHWGLRNPQELAFDEWGNLFTGDNNSDGGDKARFVQIAEGGQSGWRMSYQYLAKPVLRGPWNAEQLWIPTPESPAAYLLPPLANVGDGPSGLTYYPGLGWDEKYQGAFLLCDFRGVSGWSGIKTVRIRPRGASFEVSSVEPFAQSILATDADFGYDGGLYISDWVEGWDLPRKGRIYRVVDPAHRGSEAVLGLKGLMAEGFSHRETTELIGLLSHADQRVRQEAHLALAARGSAAIESLTAAATQTDHRLARVHAVWALGRLLRTAREAGTPLAALLTDADAEIRAQAAKVLGDARFSPALAGLLTAAADSDARVRYFAAQSLGKLGSPKAVEPLLSILVANANADAYVRHAASFALSRTASESTLAELASHPDAAARLGAVLALRHQASPRVAEFLADADSLVALEAARAIYDLPIESAFDALAATLTGSRSDEPWMRRALNARFRIGGADSAKSIAAMASRSELSLLLRSEALEMLAEWAQPGPRDRLLGHWRPLAARSADEARAALAPILVPLLSDSEMDIRQQAAALAGQFQLGEAVPALDLLLTKGDEPGPLRAAALASLAALNAPGLIDRVRPSLDDASSDLRAEALRVLSHLAPAEAAVRLSQTLEAPSAKTPERQAAIATLAAMPLDVAGPRLTPWIEKLAAGQAPAELQLDLLRAAQRIGTPEMASFVMRFESLSQGDTRFAHYRAALAGGDRGRGRTVFFEKTAVGCLRCHKVRGMGGDVGPDLSQIGMQQPREYLLEAIIQPNAKIAKGFETVVVVTSEGKVISGVLKSESETALELITPEGLPIALAKDQIEERTSGPSAMPGNVVESLSLEEIRDLVEYLANLR